MGEDRISARQLMVLLFLGLLSPGLSLLAPGAEWAGPAAWISWVLALPALLLMGWIVARLAGCLPEGQGLAEAFRLAFGGTGSKAVLLLYIVWELFLLSVQLGRIERRMELMETGLPAWLCLLAVAGTALWAAWGKLSAFARAGEIFYLFLAALLVLMLLLGAFQVDWRNLFPLSWAETAQTPGTAVQEMLCFGPAAAGGFLLPAMVRQETDRAVRRRWTAALGIALALVQLVVLGSLGAGLTARAEEPLLVLSRDISMAGAIQRLEGAVACLWLISDLTLLGTGIFIVRYLLGGRQWAAVVVAAALAFKYFCGFWGADLAGLGRMILPAGGLAFGFALPGLALLCAECRRRCRKGDISCASTGKKAKDVVTKKEDEKTSKNR